VTAPTGEVVHAAQGSRKDVRDAVVAARAAFGTWSGMTAYNRGQILYRIAEMLEGRREQFAALVDGRRAATAEVDAAIDRWVHYAGWADKYAQIVGGTNPVAGPYFNFSLPEPTGVVGVLAPQESSLLGLVSVVAPALVAGNAVVVVASEAYPLSAISLAEVLATSDLPGGVVNVLTGSAAELAPWLAAHADVNALDLSGAGGIDWVDLQITAADTLKRVLTPGEVVASPQRIAAFTELKTVWHPKSMV